MRKAAWGRGSSGAFADGAAELFFKVYFDGATGSWTADETPVEDLRDPPPEVFFMFYLRDQQEGEPEGLYESLPPGSAFSQSAFRMEFLDSQDAVVGAADMWQLPILSDGYEEWVPSVFGSWVGAVEFVSYRVVRGSEVVFEDFRALEPFG